MNNTTLEEQLRQIQLMTEVIKEQLDACGNRMKIIETTNAIIESEISSISHQVERAKRDPLDDDEKYLSDEDLLND